ncbi:MAG: signal peptidase I [Spirochaetaceae bacterium]
MFGPRRTRFRFYKPEHTAGSRLLGIVKFLILLFLVYELITTFFVATHEIQSTAMRPTLEPGDRIIVSALPYGAQLPLFGARAPAFGSPDRGDIVVFRPTHTEASSWFASPARSLLRFVSAGRIRLGEDPVFPEAVVRRVIALPGDTVRMEDFVFYVQSESSGAFESEFEIADLRYSLVREDEATDWPEDLPFSGTMDPVELDEDQYFLAADNRPGAIDSRRHGEVSRDTLLSRAVFRYAPYDGFGTLNR